MEENNQKISFFKRLKIAVFKLEDYGFFLGERFKVALKYFFILILLLSIVMALVDTYGLSKRIGKASDYVLNELPEFTYQEGIVNFQEKVEAYDHEYNFKLLINTEEISEEQIKEYKSQIYNEPFGLIILKDKFIYAIDGAEAEFSYKEVAEANSLQIKNKDDLENFFNKAGVYSISTMFFIMDLIVIYITQGLTIFSDLILIALFGLIASRFCGLKFKTLPMFALSIYSLTLSIILTGIYSIVYGLTGFVINYFNVMYLLIAYVYIIAAILMIKYDLIKQHFELEKVLEVQKQVHEEIKEQEKKEENENEENKEKKEENNEPEKEDVENNREPDGSEI